jgi:uncharacterized membrane protein YsdA (DUF1294 family)
MLAFKKRLLYNMNHQLEANPMHAILVCCLAFYVIIVNFCGFFVMRLDKRRAEQAQWRIPESSLFLVAVLGGSIGIYLGMQLFRHKTKRATFRFGIPIFFFLQIAIATFIFLAQHQT